MTDQHLERDLPVPPHGNRKRHHGKDYAKRDQPAERGRAMRRSLCLLDLDRHDAMFIPVRSTVVAVSTDRRAALIYTTVAVPTGYSPRFDVSLTTGSRKRDRCGSGRRRREWQAPSLWMSLRIDGTEALPYKPPQ